MVSLTGALDYVWLFLIAGGLGAIGGIGFELLQTRVGGVTGLLRLPGQGPNQSFVDLGFFASMILGAIAAVAVSYFFTPEVQVKVTVRGVQSIRTEWSIARVVPLSLIVGSAGGAFLRAMQARVQLAVSNQRVVATQAAGKAALVQLAQSSQDATRAAIAHLVTSVGHDAANQVYGAANDLPPHAVPLLKAAADSAPDVPLDLLAQLDQEAIPPAARLDDLQARLQQHAQAAEAQAQQTVTNQLVAASAAVDAVAEP
jgi:hypothetical protein